MSILDPSNTTKAVLLVRGFTRIITWLTLFSRYLSLKGSKGTDSLKKTSYIRKQNQYNSPIENVLDILTAIRSHISKQEKAFIEDLSYVIKVITSNKLYEKPEYI